MISNEIIITYGVKPFDICQQNPKSWQYLKIIYIIVLLFSNVVYSYYITNNIISKKCQKNSSMKKNKNSQKYDKLNLLIGYDANTNENIYVPESGLYQNFLITGTIGSGKTSSAMYPFTRTIIKI